MFTQLSPESVTLVTPNERLAASLKRQFNDTQIASGHTTWASPDILPIGRFFERLFLQIMHRVPGLITRQLISPDLSLMLWEQVIKQNQSNEVLALLSTRETAKNASAAYILAHQWRLFSAMQSHPLIEDSRIWMAWEKQFSETIKTKKLITAATLPDYLRNTLDQALEKLTGKAALLPTILVTAGFDIITPQMQQFFASLEPYGVEVKQIAAFGDVDDDSLDTQTKNVSRFAFVTEEDELRAAAAWAHEKIVVERKNNIAIVVPDLRRKRAQMKRIMIDTFDPIARTRGMANSASARQFNFSLGLPLSDYPLVFDALNLLAFSLSSQTRKPIPTLNFSALLNSSFIAGAATEMASRATLDKAFRAVASHEVNLFGVQQQLKISTDKHLVHATKACGIFLLSIDNVAQLTSLPANASPHEWREHFSQILAAWGFANAADVNSHQYQVLAKFRESLAALASHQIISPQMRASEALMLLNRLTADTVFQPEADSGNAGAPAVQVLGILESAGHAAGTFDAMWITGLTDAAWPLAATPNPFIPVSLQRSAGIPESSAVLALALDKRITQGWLTSASEIVFSHAQFSSTAAADEVRRASALTADVPITDAPPIETNMAEAMLAARANDPAQALETTPDHAFNAFTSPTLIPGGAAMLADQAACPFRAFARHRLSAKPLAVPVFGMDASDRGNLLHDVLRRVWGEIKSYDHLQALSPTERNDVVSEAIAGAIKYAHQRGLDVLTGRFAKIEANRLEDLIRHWLDYESNRAPFSVVAVEASRTATLANITMKLRLDRIDKLVDGTSALIDYKTGEAKVKNWLGPRPDEPQLPLYYHAIEAAGDSVSTLAFARVRRGPTFGFDGVSAAPDTLPNVTPIESKHRAISAEYSSWDELVQSWELSLNALASEFANGINSVTPKNGALTCARCDLQTVCRVSSIAIRRDIDSGDDSDNDNNGDVSKQLDA